MHYDYMNPCKNKDGSWTGSIVEVPDGEKREIGQEAKEFKTVRIVTENSETEAIEEMLLKIKWRKLNE
ncbi:MAG: hypothetical protein WC628_04175 [Candidatus Omnitrophota bacterium]